MEGIEKRKNSTSEFEKLERSKAMIKELLYQTEMRRNIKRNMKYK